MLKPNIFHEDIFYEYFRPFRHKSSNFDIWGGHGLETFGKDFEIVQNYPKNFVWSVVESPEGLNQWITPGIRYVNRICYLLTEVPHDGAPVEFRIEHSPHGLTPLGLTRRISTLRRILLTHQQHSVAM
jgi:hypothetical protein